MKIKSLLSSGVSRVVVLSAWVLSSALLGVGAQTLPPLHTAGSVSYLNGGIGIDESTALKAESAKWPLTLLFAVQGRQRQVYAANVQVRILDKDGVVVLTVNEAGPYLLVKLPAGRYTVEATRFAQTQRRLIQVDPAKPQQQGWSWTEKEGETGS